MSKERRPWNPYPLASLSVGSKFDLSPAAISVLIYLAVRSDYLGNTRVGQERIKSDLKRSVDFVTKAMDELRTKGVISQEKRDRRKGLTYLTTISASILPTSSEGPINTGEQECSILPTSGKSEDQSCQSGLNSILPTSERPCSVVDLAKAKAQPCTTTTSLLCCAPAPASLENQNQPQPEVTVSGYTLTEIKAHLEHLVEFGHKWATENADGIERLHPNWVEHIMTLKVPRGAKRKFVRVPNSVEHVEIMDTDCTANRHTRGTCPSGAACHPNAPAYRREVIEWGTPPKFKQDSLEDICSKCAVDHEGKLCPKQFFGMALPEPDIDPLCASCGKVPPAPRSAYCKPCRKAEDDRQAAEKAARIAEARSRPSLKEMMDAQ